MVEVIFLGHLLKAVFNMGNKDVLAVSFEDIKLGLDIFEAGLSKRSTKVFGGDKPGMLGYMIWPWPERLELLQIIV